MEFAITPLILCPISIFIASVTAPVPACMNVQCDINELQLNLSVHIHFNHLSVVMISEEILELIIKSIIMNSEHSN